MILHYEPMSGPGTVLGRRSHSVEPDQNMITEHGQGKVMEKVNSLGSEWD